MKESLENILVVSIEQAVAAPLCSCRLADAGARVIKVERPEGDFARNYDKAANGDSAYFVWLNRGKESITANIKEPKDSSLIKNIILNADVYIQNLAPGAAERAGLGSKLMRKMNPELITCDISGYGSEGNYSDMKAYDLLVQAESGLCMITGTPEAPGRVGVSVCDISCGLNAYSAILEALFARQRGAGGESIKVSLFDSLADWMNVPFLHHVYLGNAPKRIGIAHPSIAPYGVFTAKCGNKLVIAIQNEREWVSLCNNVLNEPALASDIKYNTPSKRVSNRTLLDDLISQKFQSFDRKELMETLRKFGIAFGALNEVADLEKHPQLRTEKVNAPSGEVRFIAPPVITSRNAKKFGSIPKLGEHNKKLRDEFKYSGKEK